MSSLPYNTEVDNKKQVVVDKNEEATIIIKCEGVVKDVISHLAKSNNQYGNTLTAVITQMIVDNLDEKDNITFDSKLKALTSRARVRKGEAIPYHIKSQMIKAVEESNIGYWMDDISAGLITVEQAKEKVESANNLILEKMEQGYNPADFHKNKKSFGSKWVEGDWIYEISRKTNEEEEVMIDGREITRLKRDTNDRHYLQYADNGITVICPNIFTNALYLDYWERDEYFNGELRKIQFQHEKYNDDGTEVLSLVEQLCPDASKKKAVDIFKDRNKVEVIAAHLVKLEQNGKRKKRYICLDCWDKANDTYKQIVFMTTRLDRETTSEDFFQVFSKVEQKSRRQITKKVGINFKDNASVKVKK